MPLRKVVIHVGNKVVGKYEARSYPHDCMTDDNLIELYEVPVYEITITGKDDAGAEQAFVHQAPRFMPYWNDPKVHPNRHYATLGWANSGLSRARTITVTQYRRDYEVQNRYSPGRGAIVLKGAFYIHAGPGLIGDFGFGSAGCIEIIGNYDVFKLNIASLSGSSYYASIKSRLALGVAPTPEIVTASDSAIEALVRHGKLVVDLKGAAAPDIRSKLSRKVATSTIRTVTARHSLPRP